MDKHHEWISRVYDDSFVGSCGLCEIDELPEVASESEHVLCPICGFCLKYHCDCGIDDGIC